MRWALGLAVFVLAGCDTVFGLEPHHHTDAAAPADIALDGPGDAAIDGPPGAGIGDAAGDATPDAALNVCPGTYGAVTGQTTRYRHLALPQGWKAAENDCENDQIAGSSKHTHLVVIETDAERSQLNSQFSGIQQWIGLSDRNTEGLYLWVTNTPSPPASGTPWASGEPVADASLDCAQMDGTGNYRMADCNTAKTAWCECDDDAVNPVHVDP